MLLNSGTGWACRRGRRRLSLSALNQELARILKQPEAAKALAHVLIWTAAHSTPDGFARRIASEIVMWAKVVKAGNIKLD